MADIVKKKDFIKRIIKMAKDNVTVIKDERLNPEQVTVICGSLAYKELVDQEYTVKDKDDGKTS